MASYFFAIRPGDHAVPILGDELAFNLHLVAKRLGDVDVEALQVAVLVDHVEGRVRTFGTDPEDILGLCRAGAADGQRAEKQH